MESVHASPEELARLPLKDRVTALAELVEELEQRLEATGSDGEDTTLEAEGETRGDRDSAWP